MYYDVMEDTLAGNLTLVGDENGLCFINFQKGKAPLTISDDWRHDINFFTPVIDQLNAYFAGVLKTFDLKLALSGTPFQLNVWKSLAKIPYGELTTYGAIAEKIGNPKAVRAVGGANARNPLPIVLPCHRVIGSNGTLTGFGGGLDVKEKLIALERGASIPLQATLPFAK
jgi:methylated-DNA-[protein]-cysteine S-methyltransferase